MRQNGIAHATASDYGGLVFGKEMPQATQLEEAVLGAILIDKSAFLIVGDIVCEEAFYKPEHRAIYRAIQRLFDMGRPIDLLTVMEALKKDGELEKAGGPAYLAELTHRVASAANIEFHARIIMQHFLKRELLDYASRISKAAFDETVDALELLTTAEAGISETANKVLRGQSSDMNSVARKYLARMDALTSRTSHLVGITSGLKDFDILTGGMQAGDLVIIAARPAMGKTGLALKMAYSAAKAGHKTVVYSLEMEDLKLFNRLVSIETGIGGSRLKDPRLLTSDEREKVAIASQALSQIPLEIHDKLFDLMSIKMDMVRQAASGTKVVVVDYIQLIKNELTGRSREQEVSGITRSLKMLAQMLGIHIIALSQLSRAVETRGGDKRPQLSDLRESGGIEQDADIVGLIYRPEYYNVSEYEDGTTTKGKAELIIAKHRNGPTDTLRLLFHEPTVNFTSGNTYTDSVFGNPDMDDPF